jgi:hypothetical protein
MYCTIGFHPHQLGGKPDLQRGYCYRPAMIRHQAYGLKTSGKAHGSKGWEERNLAAHESRL